MHRARRMVLRLRIHHTPGRARPRVAERHSPRYLKATLATTTAAAGLPAGCTPGGDACAGAHSSDCPPR